MPPHRRSRLLSRLAESSRLAVVGCALLTLTLCVVAAAMAGYRVHDVLTARELTNAVFGAPPSAPAARVTVAHLWEMLQWPEGSNFLKPMLPSQAGALWIFAVLAIAVAFDFDQPGQPRNLDLIALVVLGFLLYDVTTFLDNLRNPLAFQLMDWVFGAIMTVSLWLLGRAVWWSRRTSAVTPWTPNLRTRPLATLAVLALALNLGAVLIREPDDAGFYTNLGAQRLRERGQFPYGDPLLSGSAGAGYGPVLFLAHLPFQWLLDPVPVNRRSDDLPLAGGPDYRLPPMQASQLTTLTFHLAGVAALLAATRRLAGSETGWAVVALYCGSAFVMGVGGEREMVGGVTLISHIAAPSLALLAFLWLSRPLLAGFCLALSVATVFAPVYFVPAWLGYYWHDRRAAGRFVAGLVVAAIVVGAPVLLRSRATPGRGVLATVLHDTIGHHQGSDMYGQSPFGFWGQRGGVRAWLRDERVPGLSVSSPMFLLTTMFALAGFWLGRRRSPQQLAALTAALGIAAQLWKIHGTGVYVNWYYPFLLIGIFAIGSNAGVARPRVEAAR